MYGSQSEKAMRISEDSFPFKYIHNAWQHVRITNGNILIAIFLENDCVSLDIKYKIKILVAFKPIYPSIIFNLQYYIFSIQKYNKLLFDSKKKKIMIKVSFSFNIFARVIRNELRGKEREFRFDLRRREGGSRGMKRW